MKQVLKKALAKYIMPYEVAYWLQKGDRELPLPWIIKKTTDLVSGALCKITNGNGERYNLIDDAWWQFKIDHRRGR